MSCRAQRSPVLKATTGPPLDDILIERRRSASSHEDDLMHKRWLPPLPEAIECNSAKLLRTPVRARASCRSRRYAALLCTALLMPLIGGHAWLCWSLARRERLHSWRYRGGATVSNGGGATGSITGSATGGGGGAAGGGGDGGGGSDGGGATGAGAGGSVLPTTAGAQGRAAIPRIIHQMYRTTELPEDWAHVPHAWKQLHADYTYMLWTDEQLRQLIADDYPWLLATYDAYPHDTQRWDASRFAILHKYGGVYADLDIQAVERIDALLEGQQLLLPHTPNVGLTNALMASVAAHPFMSEALRLLPAYAHAWCAPAPHLELLPNPDPRDPRPARPPACPPRLSPPSRPARPFAAAPRRYHLSKHNTVLSSTGSTYLWALYMRWPDTAESEPPALMQARTWGKCSVCRPPTTQHDPDLPEGRPLFKHTHGNSWHALDSTLLLFLFCHKELGFGLAVSAVGFIFLRSRLRASCLGCGALACCWLVSALGINLFEALLCRPWIWLIMGRRD